MMAPGAAKAVWRFVEGYVKRVADPATTSWTYSYFRNSTPATVIGMRVTQEAFANGYTEPQVLETLRFGRARDPIGLSDWSWLDEVGAA